MSFYSIISKIVCLFGCVYQSYKISELYFRYETTTNVRYEKENQIDLPAITMCYGKLAEVKDEYINKNDNNSIHLAKINSLTLREQMYRFERHPKSFKNCVYKEGKVIKSCPNMTQGHFDKKRYCF